MLAERLTTAMENELVGQRRAIEALVRSVTIAKSGLTDSDAPAGMFLFLGPSGTGKSHAARALTRVLHGDLEKLLVVDCVQLDEQGDWQELVRQMAPHFREPVPGHGEQLRAMAPMSVLLVEHLEAAGTEFAQALVSAFEHGRVALADGVSGSLRNCIVVMTSRLCAREIYGEDRQEIGFCSPTGEIEESEKARIFGLCCDVVERAWGSDFLGHIDDLIIFHRLRDNQLPLILQHFVDALNQRLAGAAIRVELSAPAREFLVQRGASFLEHGAWYMEKVFRRFILFPVSDMASGDSLACGGRIDISLVGERLCFQVNAAAAPSSEIVAEIPIDWQPTTA
jgi:ATP-dependent Clp protease ATP-binding subunit ClpC